MHVGYKGYKCHTEIMVAVILAFTLKPHNSVFSSISLAPPEYLQVTKFVLKFFKRTLWFQAAFHLTRMGMIFANFHSQML